MADLVCLHLSHCLPPSLHHSIHPPLLHASRYSWLKTYFFHKSFPPLSLSPFFRTDCHVLFTATGSSRHNSVFFWFLAFFGTFPFFGSSQFCAHVNIPSGIVSQGLRSLQPGVDRLRSIVLSRALIPLERMNKAFVLLVGHFREKSFQIDCTGSEDQTATRNAHSRNINTQTHNQGSQR